ncbi:hypothetical protein JCM10207_001214 [Rhodosporidiobolus poonsookiae]
MEADQVYEFSSPEQFWAELDDLIAVPPHSTLEELDYALRNYIAFASTFMDEFLAAPGALDHALLALLSAPLFTSHIDRMTQNIISSISHPAASSSTLFISLMLVLHLGESANPLTTSTDAHPGRAGADAGVTVGSSKVFRALRRRWKEVVPVLMKWVSDAAVVEDHTPETTNGENGGAEKKKLAGMPAEGWEERVGTAATAVLYEMCRVQKLSADELADFSFDFVSHLFHLVERTRDAEDETFNYSLIKLLIALNEQFMVATVPAQGGGRASGGGGGNLPPPILPTVVQNQAKRERGPNLVLEVLKEKEHESKTFGENIIFILNRADGTPDSLCVSLLILKILYLLFTTSGTQEFFFTNDLCVLVDVFIRELCDLGEESEGLKHTYLRVLHPLMTNTQLRHHPYKRPQLRRVLENLIAPSSYREVDPTTRRLVERNLRGSWCQGLRSAEAALGLGLGEGSAAGSTLSVDAVATAADDGARVRKHRHHHHSHRKSRRQASLDDSSSSAYSSSASTASTPYTSAASASASAYAASPLSVAHGREVLEPVGARHLVGDIPPTVRSSHAAYTSSPDSAPVALPPVDDATPAMAHSVPSIRAGHDLLTPVAFAAGCSPRSVSSTHPPLSASATLAPPALIHPRPRSTSLSAAHYRASTHSLGLTDSPPPVPPMMPPSPDPSLYASDASAGTGAPAQRRRRPPPPPPSDPGTGVGGVASRPRTPALPSTPLEGSAPGSPCAAPTATRRRPPPPPGAGAGVGRGSPKSARGGGRAAAMGLGLDEMEREVRRGVEGVGVSY